MKSFKKVLCLALVVVMALGVSTVAFAGNLDKFNDADKAVAPYVEAVDVLIGLKVVNGVTTTELALDQAYTREQAAKVIAYLVLGQKAADALSTTTAPFADVEANRWSAGYIAFCVKQGIIAGYDANTFGPTDALTGYQFAKMLLTAVGYGKNGEYVGEGWSINVAKDALALGIFEGDLAAATNSTISRKQAMLMAFNTLINVPVVNYNANFQTYYTGGSFTNGIWEVEEYNKNDRAYKLTLGYTVFGLEADEGVWSVVEEDGEEIDVFTPNTDGYGRVVRSWTINSGRTDVSGNHSTAPDYTFTGKVSYKDLYNTLGKTVAGYAISYYVDGTADTGTISYTGADSSNKTKTDAIADTGASSTTEVYVDDANSAVTVVVINNYFAQVTKVLTDDEKVNLKVYDTAAGSTVNGVEATGFDKDEYVVVNMYKENGNWNVTKVVATEKVAGVEVSYVAATYIKEGSTTYNFAKKLVAKNVSFEVDGKYDLYLDSFGNVIGSVEVTESAANLNYLYVNSSKSDSAGINGDAYVKVYADFADGTTKTVKLAVKKASTSDATFFDPNEPVYNNKPEGDPDRQIIGYGKSVRVEYHESDVITEGFYSYTVNSDGFYTLKRLDSKAKEATAVSFDKASVNIDLTVLVWDEVEDDFVEDEITVKATSSSKLVLVSEGKTYTGYKNFPAFDDLSVTGTAHYLYVLDKNNNLATLYIFADTSTTTTTVFGVFNSYEGKDADYFYYKVFVDGEMKEYASTTAVAGSIDKGDIVTIDLNTKNEAEIEAFTAGGKYGYDDDAVVTDVDDDNYFSVAGAVYYFGDKDNEIRFVDFTDGKTLKDVSTVEEGQTVNMVYLYKDGATEFVAILVVITADAD